MTGLEAKFSAQHCVAVVVTHGRAVREDDFDDARVVSQELVRLRDRVVLTPMSDYAKDQARVVVQLRDGRAFDAEVSHARGTPSRPLDDGGLEEKYMGFAEPVLGGGAGGLLRMCWGLEEVADCAGLLRRARPVRGAENF